ncbi:MAG: phosphoribosyltransferase family protein [Candidatus Parcubacteria bacterium]|nr:phosphoribosyltransferase family protein [Candidatus Parcubacteria bacterium]
MRWLDFLFPPRVDEFALRDVSPDDFLSRMRVRLVQETQPETIGLLPFTASSVRAAIHEAKYRGNEHAFELLSAALVEYLRDADDVGRSTSYIVVPVPLGEKRRKERGFNQVEEIANRAAKLLGCTTDAALLERTRETASQVSLPRRARLENMRGAFRAARPADPSHTYIVIDDVITTGATLQAAIDALRAAGAAHIIPLALAH